MRRFQAMVELWHNISYIILNEANFFTDQKCIKTK